MMKGKGEKKPTVPGGVMWPFFDMVKIAAPKKARRSLVKQKGKNFWPPIEGQFPLLGAWKPLEKGNSSQRGYGRE